MRGQEHWISTRNSISERLSVGPQIFRLAHILRSGELLSNALKNFVREPRIPHGAGAPSLRNKVGFSITHCESLKSQDHHKLPHNQSLLRIGKAQHGADYLHEKYVSGGWPTRRVPHEKEGAPSFAESAVLVLPSEQRVGPRCTVLLIVWYW